MKYHLPMAFRWMAAVGALWLLGCGGRAQGDGASKASAGGEAAVSGTSSTQPTSGGPQGGMNAAAGGAGVGASGGGSTINALDDENSAGDVPVAPYPAAVFWRSPGGSWHIGNWFLTSDRVYDVGLSPVEPPRNGSTQARHIEGEGFASGVVLWLQLDHPEGRRLGLKAYAGLTFWARQSGTDRTVDVLLNDGTKAPGDWTGSPPGPVVSVMVGPEWHEVTLFFDEFGQAEPAASSIDFHVGDGGESFDLWIDDLSFFCDGPCP